MCLCGIFYDFQSVAGGEVVYSLHVCQAAVQVDGQDGTCARGNQGFGIGGVDVACCRRRLAEHGFQTGAQDGEQGGDVGVGGDNHFVSGRHRSCFAVSEEDEGEGIQSVSGTDAVDGSAVTGEVLLEAGCGFTVEVPSAAGDAREGVGEGRFERGVELLQVQVLYHGFGWWMRLEF